MHVFLVRKLNGWRQVLSFCKVVSSDEAPTGEMMRNEEIGNGWNTSRKTIAGLILWVYLEYSCNVFSSFCYFCLFDCTECTAACTFPAQRQTRRQCTCQGVLASGAVRPLDYYHNCVLACAIVLTCSCICVCVYTMRARPCACLVSYMLFKTFTFHPLCQLLRLYVSFLSLCPVSCAILFFLSLINYLSIFRFYHLSGALCSRMTLSCSTGNILNWKIKKRTNHHLFCICWASIETWKFGAILFEFMVS